MTQINLVSSMAHVSPIRSSPESRATLDRVAAGGAGRHWSAWIALALGVAFTGFIFLFSLDGPVPSKAFFMQNILTAMVLVPTIAGWWRAWLGVLGFAALAVAGCIAFRTWSSVPMFALFTLPPLIIAALHAWTWRRV